MHSVLKPGITLLIITAIAGALLGYINDITAKPIAEQERKTTEAAMTKILPQASSFKEIENITPPDGGIGVVAASEGYDGSNNLVGYAVTSSSKGYGGEVKVMVGISIEGVIQGIDIVSHSETPGLGANAKNASFSDQYKDKSGKLEVVKGAATNANEIQAITSATITSKAVTDSVNAVTDYYENTLSKGGSN